jgi:hypothetical protein
MPWSPIEPGISWERDEGLVYRPSGITLPRLGVDTEPVFPEGRLGKPNGFTLRAEFFL